MTLVALKKLFLVEGTSHADCTDGLQRNTASCICFAEIIFESYCGSSA